MAKKTTKKKTTKAKKPTLKKEENPKSFYVGVPNPVNVRRNVLETSKDIIAILKQYEHLKQIRMQKKQAMQEFNKVVKDIKSGIVQIKKKLPAVPIRTAPQTKKQVQQQQVEESKPVVHETAQLQKLEDELSRIEQKLGNM